MMSTNTSDAESFSKGIEDLSFNLITVLNQHSFEVVKSDKVLVAELSIDKDGHSQPLLFFIFKPRIDGKQQFTVKYVTEHFGGLPIICDQGFETAQDVDFILSNNRIVQQLKAKG